MDSGPKFFPGCLASIRRVSSDCMVLNAARKQLHNIFHKSSTANQAEIVQLFGGSV